MAYLVLGLDLGPNSIGWAIVDDNKNNPEKSKIVDLGVRVFPEGVDAWDTAKEASRTEQRRIARGMRRQQRRRARRRHVLRKSLIEENLLPIDELQQQALLTTNPYELRAKALDEQITLHELGRILIHLSRRRGFKSNKKEEAKADAKSKRKKLAKAEGDEQSTEFKAEDMLLKIARLEKEIKELGFRTLGEYLHRKVKNFDHAHRIENDIVRGRNTKRSMLIEEFELLWRKQSEFHPELTDKLCYGALGKQKDIHRPIPKNADFLDDHRTVENRRKGLSDLQAFGLFGIIFFHRTLKPVSKEIVGLCALESRARRCPRASRRAQRFRILQEVNNLRYIDPIVQEELALNKNQRQLLIDYLSTREKASFVDIRKKLGFLESVKFNLERGKRSTLQGMITDSLMAKALGKRWHEFADDRKDNIVDALIKSLDDDETHELLVDKYQLTPDEADTALGVELPEGYSNLSLVAINKLLPFLEEGLVYEHRDAEKSARAKAGYDEPWALQMRIFDKLPDPRRSADSPIGDIPNPVVKRTLTEVRKVVNAIMREYGAGGRIKEIHIEMGRDVKTRPKADPKNPAYRKYLDHLDEMRDRERKRDLAKDKLRENQVPFGTAGTNILKYLLWQEQNEVCAYSGRIISFSQLYTNDVEIDHILPRSMSLDDSQMNKVVCFREENHGSTGKGQRTPRQWLEHSDPRKYEVICQRAKKLPYPKYQRFLRKDAKTDDFIERQLNDTRYIAKATVEYLKCLFDHDANKRGAVLGLKGQLTSTLRRQWGLDTILEEMPDSPGWHPDAANQLRFGQKNRADHRHHAIDAVILAMTNRARLSELANGFAVDAYVDTQTGETKYRSFYQGELIPLPWKDFRNDVIQKIATLNARENDLAQRRGVSHRVERKIRGGLHKDNPFGQVLAGSPGSDKGAWVKRKPLVELSAGEILQIRDESIRKTVLAELRNTGIEIRVGKPQKGRPKIEYISLSSGKKPTDKELLGVLSQIRMQSGVPIKKARLVIKNDTVQRIREFKAQKNHDETQIAFIEPASTHHLCIFEWEAKGKRKRDAVFVTMLQAMNRIKLQNRELARRVAEWKKAGLTAQEIKRRTPAALSAIAKLHPVIERDAAKLEGEDHSRIPADARFVMSLSSREMVLANWKGEEKLLIFKTAASTQGQIYFAEHTDARRSSDQEKFVATANSLDARKVTVDPLGRIRWAND